MNNQKVIQILQQIFDRFDRDGVKIECGHDKRFENAVNDLLDKGRYPEERAVLKHASESKALWVLLNAKSITEKGAEDAVACLERESRMTREDAVFFVRCVVSALGGSPDIVKSGKSGNAGGTGAEKVSERTDNTGSNLNGQRTDNQSTAPNRKVQNTSICLLKAPCVLSGINRQGRKRGGYRYRGKLYLYSNRLEFIPDKKGEQMQLFYQDITKIKKIRYILCGAIGLLGLFFLFCLMLGGSADADFLSVCLYFLLTGMASMMPAASFKSLWLYSNEENELGYKIYYCIFFPGAHKKRAADIIRKGMLGEL